ncbi:MAG: tRNA uridine-5-carboxymethylaminomethyl(34) synthesis enzyme MnmG [Candidatus Marinimicrobia bacterium]|nr:tRNA uridine-5-carboxymethylaminomethyl(34) synthesis enzyme MnmG [Candidatus Neomarinimicrobiota bacterium]
MKQVINRFDIIVVGGGHAGVEASLIAAKRGKTVGLVTLNTNALGRMSCNPAIGGLAKGQIVREIDVLGGVMGLATDKSGIQFKILNKSKGKSVWSPRAQVDKRHYERIVSSLVSNHCNIQLIEGEAVDIIERAGAVSGVVLRDGTKIACRSVILTCGTFLNGLIHVGQKKMRAGRMGESGAEGITEALESRGFLSGRLKTGTPPRLDRRSVNWAQATPVLGDKTPTPFSYQTKQFSPPNIPCYNVKTGVPCKEIIAENLSQSPMFSGDVDGVGPRYCPSIEDKIHRFSNRDTHTLFLEPEWIDSDQIYLNGFSTSLPEHIQLQALRTIRGFESVRFFRPGYAIEYDFFSPAQLKSSLETKDIPGLFFAGQINGTSGYEEAAAQGLISGINAVQFINKQGPLTLSRDEAYIGVLIDDLITKDTLEPYRMFTSRAEYRILLRFSNTPSRLLKKAEKFCLLDKKSVKQIKSIETMLHGIVASLNLSLSPVKINDILNALCESPIKQNTPAKHILKRPNVRIENLPRSLFSNLTLSFNQSPFLFECFTEAEALIKYEGYIKRQYNQIKKINKHEKLPIPMDFKYKDIISLSNEAREKLNLVRPQTLGQAMRISGVTPADISVLSVFLSGK